MKIIHTADNHLDMPLSYLSPEKASLRKKERLHSFSEIIDYTILNKADMLLISGDLFHFPNPSKAVLSFCISEFERLGDIPVFISLGNHDYGIGQEYFPGNVHIFPEQVTTFSFSDFTVTGASFTSPSASFASLISPPSDKSKINVLCIHGDISSVGSYNPINKDEIFALGYDYTALGHIHQSMTFPRMAYPGCHDGGGFDETGTKGFLCCNVDKNTCNIQFVPSSSRVYEAFNFDISPFSSSEGVARALLDTLKDNLYSITLTGSGANGFVPNTEYICSLLSKKTFYTKIVRSEKEESDISQSAVYKLFSRYLTDNCDEETSSLALLYGTKALEGDELF